MSRKFLLIVWGVVIFFKCGGSVFANGVLSPEYVADPEQAVTPEIAITESDQMEAQTASDVATTLDFLSGQSHVLSAGTGQTAEAEALAASAIGISYDSRLRAANVTTLPGQPHPYKMAGSAASTALSVTTGGRVKMNYNITAAGACAGLTVSFDDASTAAVESANLAVFSRLVVGLRGNPSSVRMEIIDVNGNKAVFVLKGVEALKEHF